MFPVAYLITFTTYGSRLHGDDRGTVDRRHNQYGRPFLPANSAQVDHILTRMRESSYDLDDARRAVVLRTVVEVARHRKWFLLAVHVRSMHVHAVIHAEALPEKVIRDFKAYATRRLREAGFDSGRTQFWAEGGSNPYLWNAEAVRDAIHYVLDEQGERMQVYEASPEALAEVLRYETEPEA